QGQIADHADQIDIAAALTDAVDRPLHLAGALSHGCKSVGHRHVAIIVTMDADSDLQLASDLCHRGGDLIRKCSTIGVAQDDDRSPGFLRRAKRLQSVLRIVPKSIKEMLGIIKNLATSR